MLTEIQGVLNSLRRRVSSNNNDEAKLGTIAGVFTPTVLTILGVIMYLRLGQVVGNAGLLGAVLIILLAHVITISTALSVSSIVTNTRVGAGGAFAIISQSLGLEVGGSVGIPLYLAQAISTALYVLGFAEAWQRIFPTHSFAIVSLVTFAGVFLVAYISTRFAARTQFIILAIVVLSLVSVMLGSFSFDGRSGLTEAPQLWGEFQRWDFWTTFAIFFPAVTGIMSGISLSGSLKEPRKDIPIGTLGAIGLTMLIYLALSYWLSRAASPTDLLQTETIMVDKALWGWAILAGMLGATFSSALGSLVAAPRVMQALATHEILPGSRLIAREVNGEPRAAMLATAVLGLAALLYGIVGGGLNSIAAIITMFFLITYGMLNVVVLIEQNLGTVSFRPTFRIHPIIPLVGTAGCLFVMFLVNPAFSLVAIVLVLGLYGYLGRRHLTSLESDVRSGLFVAIAEWAAVRASGMPSAPERSWKPIVLAPIRQPGELTGSYLFLKAMVAPQGAVNVLGIYKSGQRDKMSELDLLTDAFLSDKIRARTTLLEEEDFIEGVREATQILRHTFFRPNILFLHLRPDSDLAETQALVDKTAAYRMGIMLLARHPIKELGREQVINVWASPQGPYWKHDLRESNLDLAILMAYQISQNWRGRINLCMAVSDETMAKQGEQFLAELIDLARLPSQTEVGVINAPFVEAVQSAPRADLSTFGLPKEPDLHFYQEVVALVDGSCIFIRDSGEESALA